MQQCVDDLTKDLEAIISTMKDEIIIIAGDFNKFDSTFLCHNFGLFFTVDAPMHGHNIFDQVFINQPGVYKFLFFPKSVVKTKHIGVLETN